MIKDILEQDYPLVFRNSVLTIDGSVYYILSFSHSRAECFNINTQEYVYVDFHEVNKVEIPRIGMFNHRGTCLFGERMPVRKFKHGLSNENTNFSDLVLRFSDEEARRVADAKETAVRLTAKTLYSMYIGKYPSFFEALTMLDGGAFSVAFDRQFAINRNFQVFYKTRPVGICSSREGEIQFTPEYEYLRIALPKDLK